MRRLLPITLLFLLSASGFAAWSQGVLQGRVSNAEGRPVEFANVGVVSGRRPYGAVSDVRGNYRLDIRTADSVTVRVSCTGYHPQELRVRLSGQEVRTMHFTLLPLSTQLSEIVVTDDRIRATAFTQIGIEKIENTVGPNDGVEALIKTLPDVSSNNELSSQYSVRGGSFDENLVYINGVEVYRPQLVRSGQQEGMSIVNPDLVDHLLFSPGGFDASYGDRLSSVLDITYSRPVERRHSLSVSLLGAAFSAQGRVGDRFTYSVGGRHHNNSYIFKSMDTEGRYTSAYTDVQGIFGLRVSDRLDISVLAIWTHNRYGLVPSRQTTTFGGSSSQSMGFDVYFDGREEDRYRTILGSLTLDYHPSDDFQLRWVTSAQHNREQELYDIQDQYWLYEVGVGESVGDTNHFDRGVGTFLEHARNYLDMGIYSTELRASHYADLGSWNFGVKAQLEQIHDRMREWKWVDSAGYSFPTDYHVPGRDDTAVYNPQLQLFCHADNPIGTLRGMAYAQREVNLYTRGDDLVRLCGGVRMQYYSTRSGGDRIQSQWLLSPRLAVSYRPHGGHDLLYRFAAGVYQQPYLYREMRRSDGTLCHGLPAQTSYQAMGTVDWNLTLWSLPFRITADIYYKYIAHLVPYTIENLRIRYSPDQQAVGYAAGVSLRVNGDFVPGLESWASVSVMQTQEDILGDGLGWLARPTDQRFNVKLFVQDYLPKYPWWRMSLSFLYGTRVPVTFPYQTDRSSQPSLPPYFRIDWGNTIQLTRFPAVRSSAVGRIFDDVALGIEVFNLFNYRNVVSFIWVADYTNHYYAVPNYLTARQINVKLTATF